MRGADRAVVLPPPRGRLFQESLRQRPFWMLLACVLVNRTTWEQARPVFKWLVKTHTIRTLAEARPRSLCRVLKPLGIWRQRSRSLPALARAWLVHRPTCAADVLALPGCGKYAADSWAIFVDDDLNVEPKDGKLNWYLERRKQHGGCRGEN